MAQIEVQDDDDIILVEFENGALGSLHLTSLAHEPGPFGQRHEIDVEPRDLLVYTVAEGVETAEEADVCMRIGFTHAQGFFFGRPIQERDVEDALRTLNPHLALRGVTSPAE